MIELDEKYVFHIPLCRFSEGELERIEIDDLLDDLIARFHKSGFESLYMTSVKSYYKTRLYDEILITIFTSGKSPVGIFKEWFYNNNGVLGQEAFAYEASGRMFVLEL